ncbi:MAG: hypothetical protein HYX68_00240, partial [Planctomycetes bacterium]|nr:hypothetical protein [Planctomycetota bacterium]
MAPAVRFWDGGGADALASNPLNWSDDTAPTAQDTIVFNATSTKSITVDSAFPATIANLRIESGYDGTNTVPTTSLTLHRPLTITNSFIQAGGAIELTFGNFTIGSGADFEWLAGKFIARYNNELVISSGATVNVRTAALHGLGISSAPVDPVILNNFGTINIHDNATVAAGGSGATLYVRQGGQLNFLGSGIALDAPAAFFSFVIDNQGTITKSGLDADILLRNVHVTNIGTLNVNNGNLRIQGRGVGQGNVATIAAGAALTLEGGIVDFSGFGLGGVFDLNGFQVTGAGTLVIDGANAEVRHAGTSSVENLILKRGIVSGTGTLTINREMYWSGGTMIGASDARTTIGANAILYV